MSDNAKVKNTVTCWKDRGSDVFEVEFGSKSGETNLAVFSGPSARLRSRQFYKLLELMFWNEIE